MSYCRFRNTVRDLRDCETTLERLSRGEEDALTPEELEAAKELAKLCLSVVKILDQNPEGSKLNEIEESQVDEAMDELNNQGMDLGDEVEEE